MGPAGPARAGQGLHATVELGGRWQREGRWEDRGSGVGRPALRLISQAKQISPELSALAVYCCATRLRPLSPAPAPPQPCQVSSLSERKAKKLIREAGRSQDVGPLGDLQAPGGW